MGGRHIQQVAQRCDVDVEWTFKNPDVYQNWGWYRKMNP